jgi:hypothetical protein
MRIKIEKNNNFYKRTKKKNEDQIEKDNTINLNSMMKLKTNKTFTQQ